MKSLSFWVTTVVENTLQKERDTTMFNALINFRQRLYARITTRRAAALDLIDAVCSHHGLSSITQLSLSLFFEENITVSPEQSLNFRLATRSQPAMKNKPLRLSIRKRCFN